MKSSTGAHFIALDHVRALAAFIVFTWHFTHAIDGYPVPFEFVPAVFPFAILDEGHCGVALFMSLSGYLFAKLLDGKAIHYGAFVWNRMLRLLPLLLFVIAIVGIGSDDKRAYLSSLPKGLLLPVWPNGGWSITCEIHFYLCLPILLWMVRKSRWLPLSVLAAALLLRFGLHAARGEVQSLAYWTLVGRIDQFVLGVLAFAFRHAIERRHGRALAIALLFSAFYWYFDSVGGFYLNPSYPSPSRVWIILPTVEGLAFSALIAWYDTSFSLPVTGVSRLVSMLGAYSYALYLLHFFWVFALARFIHTHVMSLSNFYVACAWSALAFIAMLPVGYLSYRFIEGPFLRLRKPYVRTVSAPSGDDAATSPISSTARV